MRLLNIDIDSQDLAPIGHFAINILDRSYRFEKINYKPETGPAIYALWHGWFYGFLSIKDEERKKLHLLISPSRDGEFISRVSEQLGYSIIRGSQGRGGAKALLRMIKTLESGGNVAYTVDGPRGPIFKVKEGVLKLAQMSGMPIIPLVPESKWVTTFNSWDKYQLPHLCTKSIVVYGDPVYIPKDITEEELQEYANNLETTFFDLQKQSKALLKKKF